MSEIDWSKAPEGASHYVIGWGFFKLDLAGWFICDDGEKVWRKTPYQSPDNFSWWGNAVERPSPAWSGEALPPIGCEVCVVDNGSLRYGVGEQGPVVAHVEDCAVVRMSYGLGCFESSVLSPIRTPEQIAKDEREAAIKRACSVIESHPSYHDYNRSIDCSVALRFAVESLHDAGYRKMEQPK